MNCNIALLLTDFFSRTVFAGIRERLGGRVKAMLTGSAPLSSKVMDFLRIVFSCDVFEGYGMTETSAVSALTCPADITSGQIGVPAPCIEMKLVDIPEMGYTSKDEPHPRGEIWIRGPSCFSGYYKDEHNTRETMTEDGWIITGDVGEWDGQGRMSIIDRKKSLFKLAQGEYIAPEKVEAILSRNHLIAQAFVEGNSLQPAVVAVIVPNNETVLKWAKDTHGIEAESFEALCKDTEFNKALLAVIGKLGSSGTKELKGFEVPKAIYLEPQPFSVENDLLTPSFKLKRTVVRQKYQPIIEELYKHI